MILQEFHHVEWRSYTHFERKTGTQSNINADIVRGIMIPDYEYRHDIKIASMLQSIDVKLDNESLILNQCNLQKQYLLSQMFI